MKINFAKIKFRPLLTTEAMEIGDFHKQLANALWQSRDIAVGRFALKLFDNPEIEVNEQEKGYIISALDTFYQWAKVAVLEALGEKID